MNKNLFLFCFLVSTLNIFSQAFSVMYPFTAVTPSTGTTDPTIPPSAAGATFGSFMAVGTSTAPTASFVFSFSGWGLGATNGNDLTFTGSLSPIQYYEVTITPNANYSVDLTSITFNTLRSSSGPRNWALKSNRDGFISNLNASVISNTNISVQAGNNFFWSVDTYTTGIQQKGCSVTLSGVNFTGQITPYTFRFYAWNAESALGTFRIDTVIFKGLSSSLAGVTELTQDINSIIKIYPNPNVDGLVHFDIGNLNLSKIEITNSLGIIVASENLDIQSKEKFSLNLNSLPPAIYFARFTSKNKVYTERFFISR